MEHLRPVIAGRADIQGLHLLESCAYTWIFDGATLLFRRMPRDASVDLEVPAAWTPYHRLEVDGARSCFVVTLDEGRTQPLRAWLHSDPCPRCCVEWQPLGEALRSIRRWKQRLNVVDQRFPRTGRNQLLRPFGGWPAGEATG